jgi:Ca2+-binding EF-hand superfamily protein
MARLNQSLSNLRRPGGGVNHKVLNDTVKGVYEPIERKPKPSQNIGTRNRVGRSNVGASNRRTAPIPTEIVNATGKATLNTEAILFSSPEKVQEMLPGQPSSEPNLTNALRFAQSELVRRSLHGDLHPGRGASPSRHHIPGAKTGDVLLKKPEPKMTSSRGRMVDNADKRAATTAGELTVNVVPKLVKTAAQANTPDEAIVDADRCVSVPLRLPKVTPPSSGRLRQQKPSVPTFRHTIKDGDFTSPLKKKPRDVAQEYRYKYDTVKVPGYRQSGGQQQPFRTTFQHLSKTPKQNIKKPPPPNPRRVAKNVLTELAVKVLARVNVRKTFRDFDLDKSGGLDYDEFRKGLQMVGFKVSDAEFKEIMHILDADGDGEIAYEEFCNKLGNITIYDVGGADDEPASDEWRLTLLKNIWERVDEDGSGNLDKDELGKVLLQMGKVPAPEELDEMMAEIDFSGDGQIDFDEFQVWFNRQDNAEEKMEEMWEEPVREEYASSEEEEEAPQLETAPAKIHTQAAAVFQTTTGSTDNHPSNSNASDESRSPTRSPSRTLRATQHKDHFEAVITAEPFSPEGIDFRWKVPREGYETGHSTKGQELDKLNSSIVPGSMGNAHFNSPVRPRLNVKYTAQMNLGELEDKLRARHPQITDAFLKFDTDRNGTISAGEFRDTLYKLNIPLTEAQVHRVFSLFDADGSGGIDYQEFCEELGRKEAQNSTSYKDLMEYAQEKRPLRESSAMQLLPKTVVEPLVTHPEKPKLWYFWNSPCAETTVGQHMRAVSQDSPFYITKNGRDPGSKLDQWERGTDWVKRHQDKDKSVVRERKAERTRRFRKNVARTKKAYADDKFK